MEFSKILLVQESILVWITTIAFIVFIFTLHAASIFQYGHLKALNKIGEKEECEEKYEFV